MRCSVCEFHACGAPTSNSTLKINCGERAVQRCWWSAVDTPLTHGTHGLDIYLTEIFGRGGQSLWKPSLQIVEKTVSNAKHAAKIL